MIIKDSRLLNKCFISWINRETILIDYRVVVIVVTIMVGVVVRITNNKYNIEVEWCLVRWYK